MEELAPRKKKSIDPEVRKKISLAVRKRNEDPITILRMRISHKKAALDPVTRSKNSQIQKKVWEDKNLRDKVSASHKKWFEDPNNRIKNSIVQKEVWKDPEVRKRSSIAHKNVYEDPNKRIERSIIAKKQWEDPHTKFMSLFGRFEKKTSKSKKGVLRRRIFEERYKYVMMYKKSVYDYIDQYISDAEIFIKYFSATI